MHPWLCCSLHLYIVIGLYSLSKIQTCDSVKGKFVGGQGRSLLANDRDGCMSGLKNEKNLVKLKNSKTLKTLEVRRITAAGGIGTFG